MYIVQTPYLNCTLLLRARRAAKEALEKEQSNQSMLPAPAKPRVKVKTFIKIGRPGYKVTKQKDTKTDQHSLLFLVLVMLCNLALKFSIFLK